MRDSHGVEGSLSAKHDEGICKAVSTTGDWERIPLEAVGTAKVKRVLRLRKPIRWANRFTALRMTCGLA